jgi:hypothetical protein
MVADEVFAIGSGVARGHGGTQGAVLMSLVK